ncbi:hypothetical protein VTK26DRAFT_2140 [Humicola hyalothermophila]
MAGPRAPIGTLSQHAATAAGLVRSMIPNPLKGTRKTEKPAESDSDSDSDTSTDTDSSDSGDDVKEEDTKAWAEKMKNKRLGTAPQSKANASKAAPSPNHSSRVKKESPDTKAKKNQQPASESSSSESESESGNDVKKKADSEPESESEPSDQEMTDAPAKPRRTDAENKKATSAPASESSSSSESESAESSDEESASSSSKANMVRKADASAKESSTSEEEESNSESESESGHEEERVVEKPKAKAGPASSKPAKEAPNGKKAINGAAKSKELVSESDTSSSESDDDDSAKPMTVQNRSEKTRAQPPREIITQGFQLRKAEEDVDATAVAQVLKKAKAEGKQIWYFTTPKSVPIEVIQKHAIPLDKIQAGEPIFSHGGGDYTAYFEEPINHSIKVIVPGKTGSKYETSNQSVDRVLHITRVTRFDDDAEKQKSLPATSTTVSKARPQPPGLKARYHPFGVTSAAADSASENDEDVEMSQAPPLSKGDTPNKPAKKRKHGDVEKGTPTQEETASTPAKKSKKARVDNSKAAKQTPILPPPIPSMDTAKSAKSEPQSSPSKKSKSKEKTKKKDTTSSETKPAKVTPVPPPAVPSSSKST